MVLEFLVGISDVFENRYSSLNNNKEEERERSKEEDERGTADVYQREERGRTQL